MNLSNVAILVIFNLFWNLCNRFCNQRSDRRQTHLSRNFRNSTCNRNRMPRRKRKRKVDKKTTIVLLIRIFVVLLKKKKMEALYLKFLLRISFGSSLNITVFPFGYERYIRRLRQNPHMSPMYYEGNRLFSFVRTPIYDSFFTRLARLGFYYVEELNITKCAFCGAEYTDGNNLEDIHHHECPLEHENIPLRYTDHDETSVPEASLYTSPKYEEFQSLGNREASFSRWPYSDNENSTTSLTSELANAGLFYTGHGDIVRCFSCGGCLRHWRQSENHSTPWIEHLSWFPHCDEVKRYHLYQHIEWIEVIDRRVQTEEVPQEEVDQLNLRQQIRRSNVSDTTLQARNQLQETFEEQPSQSQFADKHQTPRPQVEQNVTLSEYHETPGSKTGFRNWNAGDDPWEEHVSQNRSHRFVEIIVKRQAEKQPLGNAFETRHSEIEAERHVTSHDTSKTQATKFDDDHSLSDLEANDNPWEEGHRHCLMCSSLQKRKKKVYNPVTPSMDNHDKRVRSFDRWPSYLTQRPQLMAQAGFFYTGQGDEVHCFCCGLCLAEWEENEDPWEAHARHGSKCVYLQEERKNKFVDQGQERKKQAPANACETRRNEVEAETCVTSHETSKVQATKSDDVDSLSDLEANDNPWEGGHRHGLKSSGLQKRKRKEFTEKEQRDWRRVYNPVTPTMDNHDKRVRSFDRWPSNLTQRPQLMAQAGFFYTGDEVHCFCCGLCLAEWEENEDPWEAHARHGSKCVYLQEERKNKSIDQGQERKKVYKPKTPAMGNEKKRLLSYDGWGSNSAQSPKHLSEAGFFYTGQDDTVRCHYCDGGLREWELCHIPWEEHARWFPFCKFVIKLKGRKYIESVQKQIQCDRDRSVCPKPTSCNQSKTNNNKETFDLSIEMIQEENRQLRNSYICVICMKQRRSITFMPCGHILCCIDCAYQHSLKKCMLCRKKIRKLIKVSL